LSGFPINDYWTCPVFRFWDSPNARGNWVQIDLGSAQTLTQLEFAPCPGFEYRMVGGYFEASNDPTFASTDTTTLYTISSAPSDGLTTITFPFPGSYQFVRYVSPAGSYGNIAEMQLFGY
jgi:endoglucanase